MFLKPLQTASFRGHKDIVRCLMIDDSDEALEFHVRPTVIVNFAMFNDHTEILELALNSSWHRGEFSPEHLQRVVILALKKTNKVETFTRLWKEVRTNMDGPSRKKCVRNEISSSAWHNRAEIATYLIREEAAEVNGEHYNDISSLESRWPAKLWRRQYPLDVRYRNLVSSAARRGNFEVVKVFLDAGAKHDHALEFAAMSGSKALVKLL